MDPPKPSKSISTSTPSFSIRYNAEEEEVEQLYDAPKIGEAHSDNSSPQSTPIAEKKAKDKSPRRSGSFEDNDKQPFRLFSEFRERITKKVEEKLEDIKTERLIKDKIKKEKKDKLKTTNSLSDSEDRSEDASAAAASSLSNASSSPEKTKSLPVPPNDESDLGDISGSDEGSTPERPSTPTFTDDIVPHRPRPGATHFLPETEKKDRGVNKAKGFKMKFMKKKSSPRAASGKVEVGIEAIEADDDVVLNRKVRNLSLDYLPVPKTTYKLAAHKYPWTAIVALVAISVAYFSPKLDFLSGIFVGILLAFLAGLWSERLYKLISAVDPDSNFLQGDYTFQNVPFLSDDVIKQDTVPPEEKRYKGWMNEFPGEYDPQTYHISQTDSVYVKLVGSNLRLFSPKVKIPKRAFWSEPKYKLKFTRERAFDIAKCEVKLLPEKLIHKRIWSRKYPILINLLPNSHLGTKWAENKKSLLSDSDVIDQSISTPVNEIHVGNTMKDHIRWRIQDLLRKAGKDAPEQYGCHTRLQEVDDVFYDIEPESSEVTSVDSPGPSTPAREAKKLEKENTPPPSDPKDSKERKPSDAAKKGFEDVLEECEADESNSRSVVEELMKDEEDDEISDFVQVSPVAQRNYIVLFARTAREKDLWYRRLVAATTFCSEGETDEKITKRKDQRVEETNRYLDFMKNYGQFRTLFEDDCGLVSFDHTNKEMENYLWLNIIIARILYDAMRQDFWIEVMKHKIQKKLSVIRVPSFMEPITLARIEFSDTVPAIEWTHNVKLNNDGIWTEVEISYGGTMTMTVDTKINLIKLKAGAAKNQLVPDRPLERPEKTAYMDSSAEDSGETSTEESTDRGPNNKALIIIDKFAESNFFQKVTEHRFVRKCMENVSNTVISLNVQVKSLVGTLVLNIPPPPSDRLWYGFKPNVQINMQAKPIVGERNINMHYITSLIEKTLRSEFQKVLVMPNMDDLVIPVMNREMPY